MYFSDDKIISHFLSIFNFSITFSENSTGLINIGKLAMYIVIYPSHGYTALVEDEICKIYQAILAS